MIRAVYSGADMLCCTIPIHMTRELKALIFPPRQRDVLPQKRGLEEEEKAINDKFVEELLDLTDVKYMKDTSPLQPECRCHACRNHTRAYIHHLFKSEELLAEVLLYAHNQYQVSRLMDEIRDRVQDKNSFSKWAGLHD